jgi:hypothetical protein
MLRRLVVVTLAALVAAALAAGGSAQARTKAKGKAPAKTTGKVKGKGKAASAKGKGKGKEAEKPAPVVEIPHIEDPLPALTADPLPRDAITFAAVGDVMLGSTFPEDASLPPDDGAKMLADVTPILTAADLAFANLEGPLADEGESTKCGKKKSAKCWAYRVPTRYGQYLKDAGFDVFGIANNHAMDFGPEGRESTKKVLEALGLAYTGEVGSVAHLKVKDKKVDVIAFATYDHSNNLNDLAAARALVEESAKTADLVFVTFHGGAEGKSRCRVPLGAEMFYNENRGDLRAFAREMIDAGADLVFGHGPHVVRGMEVYKGRLIAYSLGNFATYGGFNLTGMSGLSLILEAHLGGDGTFLGGKAYPVRQPAPGGPKLDDKREVLPLLRDLSVADFADEAVQIGEDGTLLPPARSLKNDGM